MAWNQFNKPSIEIHKRIGNIHSLPASDSLLLIDELRRVPTQRIWQGTSAHRRHRRTLIPAQSQRIDAGHVRVIRRDDRRHLRPGYSRSKSRRVAASMIRGPQIEAGARRFSTEIRGANMTTQRRSRRAGTSFSDVRLAATDTISTALRAGSTHGDAAGDGLILDAATRRSRSARPAWSAYPMQANGHCRCVDAIAAVAKQTNLLALTPRSKPHVPARPGRVSPSWPAK